MKGPQTDPRSDQVLLAATRYRGEVLSLNPVSETMLKMEIRLEAALVFRPGQFCMLNGEGDSQTILGRPFSIYAASDSCLQLLFKVVGRGTARFATMQAGDPVRVLAPLGSAFPEAESGRRYLLLAGGVGLPPLLAWRQRYPDALCVPCFGARDVGDIPWNLLDRWSLSLDREQALPVGRAPFIGNVVQLATELALDFGSEPTTVLACGPRPLLDAAAALTVDRGWGCHISTEERMGCGYGACRGCVVPAATGGYLTACQDGPVFPIQSIKTGGAA